MCSVSRELLLVQNRLECDAKYVLVTLARSVTRLLCFEDDRCTNSTNTTGSGKNSTSLCFTRAEIAVVGYQTPSLFPLPRDQAVVTAWDRRARTSRSSLTNRAPASSHDAPPRPSNSSSTTPAHHSARPSRRNSPYAAPKGSCPTSDPRSTRTGSGPPTASGEALTKTGTPQIPNRR